MKIESLSIFFVSSTFIADKQFLKNQYFGVPICINMQLKQWFLA